MVCYFALPSTRANGPVYVRIQDISANTYQDVVGPQPFDVKRPTTYLVFQKAVTGRNQRDTIKH